MRQIGIATILIAAITASAFAQNVAPATGNPQTEVSPKEQGQDVKIKKPADEQAGVQSDVKAPKPSTASPTGGNVEGPHTTP